MNGKTCLHAQCEKKWGGGVVQLARDKLMHAQLVNASLLDESRYGYAQRSRRRGHGFNLLAAHYSGYTS